jgi:hypothetical protein
VANNLDRKSTVVSLKAVVREQLFQRILPDVGIVERSRGQYRVDATAWGILALRPSEVEVDTLEWLRARLVRDQEKDGRICVDQSHPDSYWPTPLAILAWQESPTSDVAQSRAVQFLLEAAGEHHPKQADNPVGHDTALKGWSWIRGTHSWIEPTALSVIALRGTGHGEHERVREAIWLILYRQLPHGGWNYGNTSVFGQELHPAPESTGAALHALAGRVARQNIQRSLDYLSKEVTRLRTPISLGWSLLALNSWGLSPPNASSLIADCLKRQERYGPYDTTSLCLLALPLAGPNGLLAKSAGAI